jgi:hypothetical protein
VNWPLIKNLECNVIKGKWLFLKKTPKTFVNLQLSGFTILVQMTKIFGAEVAKASVQYRDTRFLTGLTIPYTPGVRLNRVKNFVTSCQKSEWFCRKFLIG